MSRTLARTLAAALAASIAPACSQDNPLFALASGADETTAASASPTTTGEPGLTTADPGTGSGEASSTASTTSGVDPGSTTSSTSLTTDPIGTSTGEQPPGTSTGEQPPGTSTGQADTGEPPLEPVTVIASLATCVLLPNVNYPYLGPIGCEMAAELEACLGEIGVMILDTSFLNAGGRTARVYLRFEIPSTPDGKFIAGVTLGLKTSNSPDAGALWSGNIYQVLPFDENSLKLGGPGGTILVADPGPSSPNAWSTWQIPVLKVAPNQPLFLGLDALDSDGVLYRSSRASEDLKPRLTITYQ